MQDRKNGGERMEAVLLGLTPEVRVSDRQSPLAGALRRELAAVTGLAVTALDLDPRDESLFDTLADALEECQVLVKCMEETRQGNFEFRRAAAQTREAISAMALPEADCFLRDFIPAFEKTLDELQTQEDF